MSCPSQSSRFNHPDFIRWTIQTMKFLIVEPSPLPILIPLGPKYSPHDPVFKYPIKFAIVKYSNCIVFRVLELFESQSLRGSSFFFFWGMKEVNEREDNQNLLECNCKCCTRLETTYSLKGSKLFMDSFINYREPWPKHVKARQLKS